jgi:hypothetical protein
MSHDLVVIINFFLINFLFNQLIIKIDMHKKKIK